MKSTEAKIKEGRGQGDGSDYIPWILISELSSSGTSSRMFGIKVKREHHLLSYFERNYFLMLDFSSEVKDIKEQFPLLELKETESIASNLGIRHPSFKSSNIVLTTDFLIVKKDGTKVARTLKPLSNFSKRQLEKFEIERVYWQRRDIDWGIVTERDMPNETYLKNLKDLHNAYTVITRSKTTKTDLLNFFDLIQNNLASNLEASMVEFAAKLDVKYGLEGGTLFQVLKFLIAIKAISFDLNIPFSNRKVLLSDIKIGFAKDELSNKSDLAA